MDFCVLTALVPMASRYSLDIAIPPRFFDSPVINLRLQTLIFQHGSIYLRCAGGAEKHYDVVVPYRRALNHIVSNGALSKSTTLCPPMEIVLYLTRSKEVPRRDSYSYYRIATVAIEFGPNNGYPWAVTFPTIHRRRTRGESAPNAASLQATLHELHPDG